MKKVLYIDMDNVLVDFPSGIAQISVAQQQAFADRLDEVPGIFSLMSPLPQAIESLESARQKESLLQNWGSGLI